MVYQNETKKYYKFLLLITYSLLIFSENFEESLILKFYLYLPTAFTRKLNI